MPGIQVITEVRPSFAGLLSSKSRLHRWRAIGLDLLFPHRCAGCGRVDVDWCDRCQARLDAVPLSPCEKIVNGITIIATGEHTGELQRAVQALKYENLPQLSIGLGQRLAALLNSLEWSIDAIVPVPLHPDRLASRGYNQAGLLADVVAAQMAIPCFPAAIWRTRDTHSQVGLNGTERKQNVEDAFAANSATVTGKTLLLVDDVCTTGATLNACAQAAFQAGAQVIYGLTVTTALTMPLPYSVS